MAQEGLGAAVPAEQLGGPEILNDDILYAPIVLRGLAADIGRRHQRREGEYYLTPAIHIADDDLAINALVRTGYRHYESDQTVFVVEGEDIKPWVRISAERVTRGDGEIVEDLDDRKRIGVLLRQAGVALDKAVIGELEKLDPGTLFEEGVDEQIRALEDEIAVLQARLATLQERRLQITAEQQTPQLKTIITIRSGWERDGEESPTTEYDDTITISEALDRAVRNFRAVNHRSDVQGMPSVKLQQGEITVGVPPQIWERYFQMISGPQGFWEQTGLKHAQDAAQSLQSK